MLIMNENRRNDHHENDKTTTPSMTSYYDKLSNKYNVNKFN